jgi:hypothetical protein
MAAAASRVYVVSMTRVSVSGAITLLQIKAGATVPLQIIRMVIGQTSSTTSTQQAVQINRKSAAATVTTFTPVITGPVTDPAASAVGGTSATGTNASAEGTDSGIVKQDVFNYLNGWQFLPTPKEYTFVDAASILGLKLPVAPGSSTTFTADAVMEELA